MGKQCHVLNKIRSTHLQLSIPPSHSVVVPEGVIVVVSVHGLKKHLNNHISSISTLSIFPAVAVRSKAGRAGVPLLPLFADSFAACWASCSTIHAGCLPAAVFTPGRGVSGTTGGFSLLAAFGVDGVCVFLLNSDSDGGDGFSGGIGVRMEVVVLSLAAFIGVFAATAVGAGGFGVVCCCCWRQIGEPGRSGAARRLAEARVLIGVCCSALADGCRLRFCPGPVFALIIEN